MSSDNSSSENSQVPSLFAETLLKSRRKFLRSAGVATFSATAVAMLAGYSSKAAFAGESMDEKIQQDIRILGTAISAEREAVAAYQLGAESGLLSAGILKVALQFQGHHKAHIEALSGAVKNLGGKLDLADEKYNFPVEKLKSEKDVLEFAAGLERGAVTAYAGAIPAFDNRDLSAAAASILADEAMHWAVLRNALKLDPVPGAFFS